MTTTTVSSTPKTSNDRLHQIRIVIADDHPVVRIGVKNMLQSDPGLDVIGDYLTEVNVTSPTCIRELDAQFGLNIAGMLFDVIEKRRT